MKKIRFFLLNSTLIIFVLFIFNVGISQTNNSNGSIYRNIVTACWEEPYNTNWDYSFCENNPNRGYCPVMLTQASECEVRAAEAHSDCIDREYQALSTALIITRRRINTLQNSISKIKYMLRTCPMLGRVQNQIQNNLNVQRRRLNNLSNNRNKVSYKKRRAKRKVRLLRLKANRARSRMQRQHRRRYR